MTCIFINDIIWDVDNDIASVLPSSVRLMFPADDEYIAEVLYLGYGFKAKSFTVVRG